MLLCEREREHNVEKSTHGMAVSGWISIGENEKRNKRTKRKKKIHIYKPQKESVKMTAYFRANLKKKKSFGPPIDAVVEELY